MILQRLLGEFELAEKYDKSVRGPTALHLDLQNCWRRR